SARAAGRGAVVKCPTAVRQRFPEVPARFATAPDVGELRPVDAILPPLGSDRVAVPAALPPLHELGAARQQRGARPGAVPAVLPQRPARFDAHVIAFETTVDRIEKNPGRAPGAFSTVGARRLKARIAAEAIVRGRWLGRSTGMPREQEEQRKSA